ncbi:MAG: ABC transporter permease [Bacillota bacterium]
MMFSRLVNLFKLDLNVTLRNALAWVMGGTLVIMILTVHFLIPDSEFEGMRQYFLDETEHTVLKGALLEAGVAEEWVFNSYDSLHEAVLQDRQSVGLVYRGSLESLQVVMLHHGALSPENVNLLRASLEKTMAESAGLSPGGGYQVEYLRELVEPVSNKMHALPSLLAFEVIVIGFLMVAVMIFQEKSEGTIKAYRVSPGRTGAYLLSKTLVFASLGLIYGLVFIFSTMGLPPNLPLLCLVLALAVSFYTLAGAAVAVFFNNISEWIFVGVGLLMLNMVPIISYGYPAFSPAVLTYLPSYPLLFGLRELLVPTGKPVFLLVWLLLALNAAAFALCLPLVHRKLMKEGRS